MPRVKGHKPHVTKSGLVHLHVLVDAPVYHALQRRADRDGVTLSSASHHIIRAALFRTVPPRQAGKYQARAK